MPYSIPIENLRGANSEMVVLKFAAQPQANDKFYLPQNSELDNSIIVGITAHVQRSFIIGEDMATTWTIDGVTYNVVSVADLANIVLTIVDDKRNQVLQQYPLRPLINTNAIAVGTPVKVRKYPKYKFRILTGESFITFTLGAAIAPPFIIPIEFFYNRIK